MYINGKRQYLNYIKLCKMYCNMVPIIHQAILTLKLTLKKPSGNI